MTASSLLVDTNQAVLYGVNFTEGNAQGSLTLGRDYLDRVGNSPITNYSYRFRRAFIAEGHCDGISFTEGVGTASEPYKIANICQLQNIDATASFNKYYQLKTNIEAIATRNWNNGLGFQPIGSSRDAFRGSLAGNNFTISNLTIKRDSSDNVGLFAVIDNATLDNIVLEDLAVEGNK